MVLSSHILPEVSMVCERVLIIHQGHIVAEDTPENLAQTLQGVDQLQVEINGPPREVTTALRNIEGVIDVNHRNQPDKEVYLVKSEEGLDLRDEIYHSAYGFLKLNYPQLGQHLGMPPMGKR